MPCPCPARSPALDRASRIVSRSPPPAPKFRPPRRRGCFTREQVGRIIAYGRARHIDVIPCLELYGHLHDLFRVERYSDLATIPNGGEFNPANPRVLALLTDWINQFASLFPSPFVHVGFDETWEIETAAKHQGTGTGPAKLYIRQLENVDQL